MSGLLTDIAINENEGVRWAKLGAWTQLIAANISGGGGGGVTSIIAGSGISVDQATGAVTVTNTGGAPSNYEAVANNAGNTTVTPDKPIYDLGLTIGGAARTSIIILDTAGRDAGDTIKLIVTFPVTQNIVLEVRDATAGGTLLLPAEIFPAQQYTTNGLDVSAMWEFVYTGSAWRYVMSSIPA